MLRCVARDCGALALLKAVCSGSIGEAEKTLRSAYFHARSPFSGRGVRASLALLRKQGAVESAGLKVEP